jgi:threonine dehydrogenase-like Zn-dependent dehydrogenase
MPEMMRAYRFHGRGDMRMEKVPIPKAGFGEAIVRVSIASMCGTDLHILKGEYPVKAPKILGHEFMGVIHELGEGIHGYKVGDRVVLPSATPCGQCEDCLQFWNGKTCKVLGGDGGFNFGNTIDGAHAEYVRVPFAQANMAKIPDALADEQVLLVGDTMSTGIGASDHANVTMGDIVVVVGQGPVGLAATAGARLKGASLVIGVEMKPDRIEMSKRMGADAVVNPKEGDPIEAIRRLTDGHMADVSVEAFGAQATFDIALKAVRYGGTLSNLGIYSKDLLVNNRDFLAGCGDINILTTSCHGGKERLRRLLLSLKSKRMDMTPLITHRFRFDDIGKAYEVFDKKLENVLKVALYIGVPLR